MIIKVCGIKSSEDLAAVSAAGADLAGMIFYPASARYAGGCIDTNLLELFSRTNPKMKRVGVFVDADEDEIRITAETYFLDTLQFHGNELVELCEKFRDQYTIIKAFSIETGDDFQQCMEYAAACHYFLFDTSGPLPGGNGYGWDWNLLSAYEGDTPFLLSGGIGQEDILKVMAVRHPQFAGIDINSRFEKMPGVKNVEAIKSFIRILKAGEYAIHSE